MIMEFIKYLFEKPFTIRRMICRLRGHKCGVWWNSHNLEPDMHCRNCGDDLG